MEETKTSYNKEYYEKNKDKIIEASKKYNRAHKEQCNEYRKRYYGKNKEHYADLYKDYYEKNKDEIKKRKAEWYKKNKENISNKHKQYRQKKLGIDPMSKKVVAIFEDGSYKIFESVSECAKYFGCAFQTICWRANGDVVKPLRAEGNPTIKFYNDYFGSQE